MNLPIGEWLPRSSAINLLAGCFLLSALYALGQRRGAACIRGYAWNSISLGGIALLVAAATDARQIWVAAALALAIKGFLIPRLLQRALARRRVHAEAEPFISVPSSMLIAGALVAIAFSRTRALFGATDTILAACLPISVATALLGLFMMVTRPQALLMVVGLVILENAVFLAAISLTYGMPLVVGMGVLLDILVGVALLGLFAGRIDERFETADVTQLTSREG
jgi:hydrogenase-4 membrane subunit HyfE